MPGGWGREGVDGKEEEGGVDGEAFGKGGGGKDCIGVVVGKVGRDAFLKGVEERGFWFAGVVAVVVLVLHGGCGGSIVGGEGEG